MMLVRGLFSSWAKPPIICPMAARRSLWMICCSSFLSTVMSRTETITPLALPSASNSGLALARMVRQLPSRWRAPNSQKPNFFAPVLTS